MAALERRAMLASVTSSVLDFAGPIARQRFSVDFDADVSASLSAADLVATNLRSGTAVPLRAPNYSSATDTATFEIDTALPYLPDGNFDLTIDPAAVSPALAQEHIAGGFFLGADFNRDRMVNSYDHLIFAQNYGLAGRTFAQGDANYDGTVDSADFLLLSQRYNTSVTPPPTGMTELTVDAVGTGGASLAWNYESATPIDGFAIFRSADGAAFTQVATQPYDDWANTGSYVDAAGLSEGTKYWYRVRPYHLVDHDGNAGTPMIGELGLTTNKDWAVTTLPAPTLDRVEAGGTVATVWFADHSSGEAGYTITATPIDANGVAVPGGTRVTMTAPAVSGTGAQDYAFVDGLLPGTRYRFAVRATNSLTSSATTIAPHGTATTSASDARLPASDFTSVYSNRGVNGTVVGGHFFPPGAIMYSSAVSTSVTNPGPNGATVNGSTFNVNLSELPKHRYASLQFSVMTGVSDGAAGGITVAVTFGGQTQVVTTPGYVSGGSHLYFKGNWFDDNFLPTSSDTLTATVTVTNLVPGAVWSFEDLSIETFLPAVDISVSNGTVDELDANATSQLRVARTGFGNLLSKPLPVKLERDEEESTAVLADFEAAPNLNPTIQEDQTEWFQPTPIAAKDDAIVEAEVETLKLNLVRDGTAYLIGNDNVAQLAVLDDDFEIKGPASVEFNDQGVRRDVGVEVDGELQSQQPYNDFGSDWYNGSGSGTVSGSGTMSAWQTTDPVANHSFPISFARNVDGGTNRVSAYVRYRVRGTVREGTRIVGAGTGVGGGSFEVNTAHFLPTTWQPDPNPTLASQGFKSLWAHGLTSSNKLPSTTESGDLTVIWNIKRPSRNGERSIADPAISKNKVYVTGVGASNAFHTVLALSTAVSADPTTAQGAEDLTSAVWGKFSGRVVKRETDGRTLPYYSKWDIAHGDDTTDALILKGDSGCQGWAGLMLRSLETAGVSGMLTNITAKKKTGALSNVLAPSGILVGEWTMAVPTGHSIAPTLGFKYLNTHKGISYTANNNYAWAYSQATYDSSSPAQGGVPLTPGLFKFHQLVKVGDKYYDPSYGGDRHDSLDAYRQQMIAGYVYQEAPLVTPHIEADFGGADLNGNGVLDGNPVLTPWFSLTDKHTFFEITE